MIGIRLQGGPADGDRAEMPSWTPDPDMLAPRLWVSRCPCGCGWNWRSERVPGAEVYRRDEERDGWLIYVYTDQDLDRHVQLTSSVLALDGASA
jgi:hypothetical protein